MKILISPAKSIDTKLEVETPTYTTARFVKESNYLMSKLAKLKIEELAKLMHVSDDIASMNVQRNKAWQIPEQPSEIIKPAATVFTGEVYKGLNFAQFTPEQMMYANDHLRILSGLYGLLRPLDLMYPYRLEMGTRWALDDKHKNLYSFWDMKINESLSAEMQENEVIINLASTEYFKAVQAKKMTHRIITPHFKEFKNGDYKIVMMYAKHARGAMAKYIIENEIQDPEMLKEYNVDGYRFDENLSTENDWVFTR